MTAKAKSFLSLFPILLLLFFLFGCSNSSDTSNESAGAVNSAPDVLADIKASGKLVVGTSPGFPPLEFYVLDENGDKQIAGSDLDLAQAIADEIGVDLEIKATDFNGVLANIQAGSIDLGISGLSYSKERAEVMDLSDGYQQETSNGYQGLVVSKETAAKYSSLEELKEAELTVGVQGGSIQHELASTITSVPNIKQYSQIDDAILALNAGDIDAVAVLTTAVEPTVASFTNLTILPEDTFGLDPDNLYGTNVIGIPKKDGNESLVELVNKVIKDNIENGNIDKWKEAAVKLSKDAIEE